VITIHQRHRRTDRRTDRRHAIAIPRFALGASRGKNALNMNEWTTYMHVKYWGSSQHMQTILTLVSLKQTYGSWFEMQSAT